MALVLVVLGAIALDLTAVAGAQRSAERVLAAAVDDAAGMIDSRAHQIDGTVRIDTARAERYVVARIDAARLPGRVVEVRVAVTDTVVEATVRVQTPHIFLRAVPGMSGRALSSPIHIQARLRG
ncbi:MAG: hypothetical protein JST64_12800 [Actinobacteria bacterium]|nr:hypothetical protein [Actinomycetota bacterium]